MALDDDIAVLERAPLFHFLDREALRIIAFAAEIRTLKPREVLFRKGDRSDGGYVVTLGSIALDRGDDEGPAFVAEPGSLIGQTTLFVRTTRAASAIARERASVLRISPSLMRRVLQEFPEAAAAIQAELQAELARLSEGLAEVRAHLVGIDRDG